MYVEYVTRKEYTEYGFGEAPEDFEDLVKMAGDMVDYQTRYFYVQNNIKEDKVTLRVTLFKKAVCAQVKYYDDLGATSAGALNSTPNHISIGRTSITNSGQRGVGNGETVDTLSEDTRRYLSGTGLLYRGLC